MAQKTEKVWCIAYINKDHISKIEHELYQFGYKDRVRAFVPTVKILRKQFKKEKFFEEVPLLFNYGFFELPYEEACYDGFLGQLRQDISAIFAWVKDPIQVLSKKPELSESNKLINYPRVALATEREMANIVSQSRSNSIFMDSDISKVEPGKHIVLKGYPFDDLPAEVISINRRKKEVRVRLELDSIIKEAVVSFENVFYTVYEAHDVDANTHDSLDEMTERNPYLVDKIFVNLQ